MSPPPPPATPKPSLDHLILFLPPSPQTLLPLLPPFISTNFTPTPGGTHADNLTANTLLLLADGSYIELICFLPPPTNGAASTIATHWWGPLATRSGWTDWCLTNAEGAAHTYDALQTSYAPPVRGGRKRGGDGAQVQWDVTFPRGEYGGQGVRGKAPFFCHDVTPRQERVALSLEATTHACGALGVRRFTVVVESKKELDEVRKLYRTLLGEEEEERGDGFVFRVGRVRDVEGSDGGAWIVLRLPQNEIEAGKVKEKGFWFGNVVLEAKAREGIDKGTRQRLDIEDDVGGLWVEYR